MNEHGAEAGADVETGTDMDAGSSRDVANGGVVARELEAGVVHVHGPDQDGVAVLRLGAPGERIVTLTERRLHSLELALAQLPTLPNLRAVIVTGPGPDMFAAGADIAMIEDVTDPEVGARGAAHGRALFGKFQDLAVPIVGAIDGPCVGGAYEMALCFDVRVASDARTTSIGLPEVKLGIVPGFGGTQRLPRLIGLPAALDVILQGKVMPAARALRAGLVDRVVPQERLLDAARTEALRLVQQGRKGRRRRLRGAARWMSVLPPLRALVVRKVSKTLTQGQARFYEAPRRALELCADAFAKPPAAGFAREAQVLGELIVSPTSKALVRVYFLTERAKKSGRNDAPAIERALVVGGGVMGAGIAGLLAEKDARVRLCDLDPAALARAKAKLARRLRRDVERRRLQPHEAQAAQDRLAVATEWGSLARTQLFLEAVVENLDLKRQLFAEAVQRGLPDTALIGTNTSSLPVDRMADGVPAPERVVGLHFFNPPEKMPLVEVIRGPRTSDQAVAGACKLAVRLGKFPIVVRDAPGFLVNRCLAPYLNEAAQLLLEGNEPEFVDRVMLDFGLPMGPARLLDEVGFDVALKVSETLSAAFPDRMSASPLFAAMVAARALGQKSGGGLYDASGAGPGPGRAVLARLRGTAAASEPRAGTGVGVGPAATASAGGAGASRSDIVQRLVYPMVDEAWRCLAEGIVADADDLDLGLIMGIGWPPFTGGITRFAEREGLKHIVAALDELARRVDPRFAPSDALRRQAVEA